MQLTRSSLSLDSWKTDLVIFSSLFATRPEIELLNIDWQKITEIIAPSAGVIPVNDKTRASYFISTALKFGKFKGMTLQADIAAGGDGYGKQRSKTHVSNTTSLIYDLDNADIRWIQPAIDLLKQARISYLMYTTHSHMKLGQVRLRMVIPIDQSLTSDQHTIAHDWLNDLLFDGKGDRSGRNLYQCQSVWACPLKDITAAKRSCFNGGVLHIPNEALSKVHKGNHVCLKAKFGNTWSKELINIQQIHALTSEINILKNLKFSKIINDGGGRESTVLKLSGVLRSRGFTTSKTLSVCHTWSDRFCNPPLDYSLIEDRCHRYSEEFSVKADVASELAKSIAHRLLSEEIRKNHGVIMSENGLICAEYLKGYHPEKFSSLGFSTAEGVM